MRTLVQALGLCIGRTAHRESRGIALPFSDHGTREGWGVSVMPRPLFTPEKVPVPIIQKAGWSPRPIWTGAEKLASPRFDPRTVQPVASRYTDYAIRPTNETNRKYKIGLNCSQVMVDNRPNLQKTVIKPNLCFPVCKHSLRDADIIKHSWKRMTIPFFKIFSWFKFEIFRSELLKVSLLQCSANKDVGRIGAPPPPRGSRPAVGINRSRNYWLLGARGRCVKLTTHFHSIEFKNVRSSTATSA